MSNPLPFIVCASLVGGGIAGAASVWILRDHSSAQSKDDGDAPSFRLETPETAPIIERLAALEQRMEDLALEPIATRVPASGADTRIAADTEERLAAVEAAVETMNHARGRTQEASLPFLESLGTALKNGAEEPKQSAEDARAAILDPASDEAAKLKAWARLRWESEWGDAVLQEMIRVGETSQDEDVRADVWRQADGESRNTLLVGPLIRALQSDPAEKAREEAAETLANYLDEPGVKSALEDAAHNDSDKDVREQASESLGRR